MGLLGDKMLLELKKTVANIKLGSNAMYHGGWIADVGNLNNDIGKICLSTRVINQEFMIHSLNMLIE